MCKYFKIYQSKFAPKFGVIQKEEEMKTLSDDEKKSLRKIYGDALTSSSPMMLGADVVLFEEISAFRSMVPCQVPLLLNNLSH